MTEKRFSIKEGSSIGLSSIYTDNGKVMTQLEVLDVLIKQHETIQTLTKENEQFQDRVFSWIDMHLQRLPTLIDKEFNSDNECADPSLYSGALQILETMKKELKGDVE